jgi:2-polyprenyl-3-methyl-5-hydroxy-6-metoxy-1,4-benzoquinol methylase
MVVNGSGRCVLGCVAGVDRLAAHGVGSRYVQCRGCGLAFVREPPAASLLQEQYVANSSSTTGYYRRTEAADRITFQKRLRLLERFQPAPGRLLDVGCTVGTLMNVARARGWEVEGVEPNPRAAQLARDQGLTVHQGFFERALVQRLTGGYHGVVMGDVIEHLRDPGTVLRLTAEVLAAEGYLLLTTPNFASYWCRRFQLKPGEHLVLFSAHNLRLLLERESFEVCLLAKTSRRRVLGQLSYSTTVMGAELSRLVSALCRLRLDGLCALLMEALFRDELLVVARKARRMSR